MSLSLMLVAMAATQPLQAWTAVDPAVMRAGKADDEGPTRSRHHDQHPAQRLVMGPGTTALALTALLVTVAVRRRRKQRHGGLDDEPSAP